MTRRGDLLVYRGVEPVPGKYISYEEDSRGWRIVVELTKTVAAVWKVEVNGHPSADIEFLGSRVVVFYVPDTAKRRFTDLTNFLQNSTVRILADTTLHKMGGQGVSQIASVAIGFGTAPVVKDTMEVALQRCIRFLLMNKDPLKPGRGGRILQLRRRGLLSETVAQRLIETACQSWNRYPAKYGRPQGGRFAKSKS